MSKKRTTEVAIRREASLAPLAWERLEAAAKKTMNGGPVLSLQLVADTQGITALVRDEEPALRSSVGASGERGGAEAMRTALSLVIALERVPKRRNREGIPKRRES